MGPGLLCGGEDPSRLHSITPIYVGGISLVEENDGLPIDDKLVVLSLDCAVEVAMDRVILECVDHIVEVNDGNNIHWSEMKAVLVTRPPNIAKSIHPDLHHHVLGTRLALHNKIWLCIFIFCTFVFCLHKCLCRGVRFPVTELQTALSCHVDAGNGTWVL